VSEEPDEAPLEDVPSSDEVPSSHRLDEPESMFDESDFEDPVRVEDG
jgi:hypothetical protein